MHFLKGCNLANEQNSTPYKWQKPQKQQFYNLLESQKLISRKRKVTENFKKLANFKRFQINLREPSVIVHLGNN